MTNKNPATPIPHRFSGNSTKRDRNPKLRGFTLIELLLAMAVMVMLAGVATLSLKGPYEKVRMKNAFQQFELLDQRARFLAKKRGEPVWIHMNVKSNLLSIVSSEEESAASVKQTLGTGVKITKAAIPGRFFDNENVMVQVSPHGETCSYAVCFVVGKQSSWLLVTGTTGQMTIAPNKSYVEKTLAQCSQ